MEYINIFLAILVNVICFTAITQAAPSQGGEIVSNKWSYNGTIFKTTEHMKIRVTVRYPEGWTISEIVAGFEWSENGDGNGSITSHVLGKNSWEILLSVQANTFGMFEVDVTTEHEMAKDETEESRSRMGYIYDEMYIRTSGPGIVGDVVDRHIQRQR
ncbi:hypothetical protein L9F63_008032 [Diploptera punctata]|uniref:Uncharacterized protein n=1 Tax=Diploptera punctata TaxID=6984 RepID=A0AAD7Z6S5_DIPPU|nr:hypothetical protein L9F63_008032 [Diploptera punctata]